MYLASSVVPLSHIPLGYLFLHVCKNKLCETLDREKELIVFVNNNPTYVLMTIEQYESINSKAEIKDNEDIEENKLEEQSDENLETLLNKIGKKSLWIIIIYLKKI